MRQFIYNNGDSEAHINADVVPRLPSRFESNWFSVEIRPNLPVPILVENEQLQIWQLLTALLAFLELKHSHLHIVSILNKHAEKTPQHFNASLFVTIWVAVIGTFLTIDARIGHVMIRAFYEILGLACRPTILPLGLHAG